jgi:hypothetical protein
MKFLVYSLAVFAFHGALIAKPIPGEEVEFRIEPSFRDGVYIYLGCESGPKIRCLPHSFPRVREKDEWTFGKPKPLKEAIVSAETFDALIAGLESAELRAEAEGRRPVGVDGEIWIFNRKLGGRSVELRFWSPGKSSVAFKLGVQFLRAAHIELSK